MKVYFFLQFRMMNRHIRDFGIHPLPGWIFSLVLFTGLSFYLFYKTEFAAYIYILIALGPVIRLNDMKRNRFLQGCFPARSYLLIRIAENGIVILPFLFFLFVKVMILPAVVLLFLAILTAVVPIKTGFSRAIPTPFGRRPFEFAAGFRNSWPFVLFSWTLTIISLVTGNFNLGIFSLIMLFLITFTFYLNPEEEFYVWIFAMTPGKFMLRKVMTSFLYVILLSSPTMVILGAFYPGHVPVILGFTGLGLIYLSSVILAKYASFPGQISLPVMMLLAFSLTFPPLLGAIIPFLWIKSVRHLSPILP